MRNGSAGPLGAVVLFSGVLAVPLLAVFGVPQFAPVSASPGDDFSHDLELSDPGFDFPESDSATPDSRRTSRSENTGPAAGWNDPFRPQEPSSRTTPNASAEPPNWNSPPGGMGEWQTERSDAAQPARTSAHDTLPVSFDAISVPASNGNTQTAEGQARQPAPRSQAEQMDSTRQLQRDFAWAAGDEPSRSRVSPADSDPFDGNGTGTASSTSRRKTAGTAEPQSAAGSNGSQQPRRLLPDFGQSNLAGVQANGSAATQAPGRIVDHRPKTVVREEDRSVEQAPLTWRSAVARLNALGIRHFQLEPGETGGFLFSCSYTPGDSPRITRRFEAEAAEPLQAVERVLAQVEQWLHQR